MSKKTTSDKQRLLVEYLISSPDTFALCKSIVRSEYFDPNLRPTIDFIHDYYDKYSTTPDIQQVTAETGVKLKKQDVTKDKVKYCSEEVAEFCRNRAVEHVLLDSYDKVQDGNTGAIIEDLRSAMMISLNSHLGINYFDDPVTRIEKMVENVTRVPTGWKAIDKLLNGGLARTEILLFTANSGGGKSIALANLAVNFLVRKFNVLYLTLELSEELVSQRFDIMYTGVPSVQWIDKRDEIAQDLTLMGPHMGRLDIKFLPSATNANSIRAYLKELELRNNGYVPDLLIVDYLDKMSANEYVSADNVWEKDKRATEQLVDIGKDYNMFIATASQQNRAAVNAETVDQSHIAGGISKINTVDWHLAIILNKAMKASGEIGFQFVKTRSSAGEGETVFLHWDNIQLRIMNPKDEEDVDEDGVILEKVAQSKGQKPASKTLSDLMDI